MSNLPTLLVSGSLRLSDDVPQALTAMREETPLSYIQGWLRQRMPEFGGRGGTAADRVLIVRAETGSGKSTVLPVGIMRILRAESSRVKYRGPGVICTQPRVLTAVALATDVSSTPRNPDMVLGETVSYQTGPVSSRRAGALIYATAGILAAQLRALPDGIMMDRYRFIIVDEAHERSVESDMMLMLLRNFLERNSGDARLPFIILTSATFDPEKYATYFGVGAGKLVEVVGRQYPIVTRWPPYGSNNYVMEAAEVAMRIHRENLDDPPAQADILIFVPGLAESKAVVTALSRHGPRPLNSQRSEHEFLLQGVRLDKLLSNLASNLGSNIARNAVGSYGGADGGDSDGASDGASDGDSDGASDGDSDGESGGGAPEYTGGTPDLPPFLVLTINREVVASESGDFILLFAPPESLPLVRGKRPARRIIVSTIVAETGLTINTLKYVIDGGWHRTMETYPPWGATGLITRPATRSRIAQRRGRVGRLFPGVFYPLYTERSYKELEDQQLPDIVTNGIGAVFLGIVASQQVQKLHLRQTPEFRVEDFGLLDPPPPEVLIGAIRTATSLGFLAARAPAPDALALGVRAPVSDAQERVYGLTELGWVGAQFIRTPMEGIRVLLAGYAWGAAASDLLTAVAMFGTQLANLFIRKPRGQRRAPTGPGREEDLPTGAVALRMALPPYLRAAGAGRAGDAAAAFYRARLLIADDFVEAILIFDAFMTQLDASAGSLAAIAAWCAECGLDIGALVQLARQRDAIADEMVVAGLDPMRLPGARIAAAPIEEFTPALRRLKRCLFDGLRGNLLRYEERHDAGPGYDTVDSAGLHVRCPPLFTDAMADQLAGMRVTDMPPRPRWIVTDVIRIVAEPRRGSDPAPPLFYGCATNLVSVLDGYVDVDVVAPREFERPQ